MAIQRMAIDPRYRLIVAGTLMVTALLRPGAAEACSVASILTPQELVEQAAAIIHVKVRGMCDEVGGPCSQLAVPGAARGTAKPYAPGWPPVAVPSAPNLYETGFPPRGAGYKLLALDVVEVLKGPPVDGRFAIRGMLVDRADYNDREPPYDFVRRGGRSGNCFAYTYQRDGEYLLFLRGANEVMTPYWSALAPVNEQIRSKDDPWITWVRGRLGGK
jgi:hypothetical protein